MAAMRPMGIVVCLGQGLLDFKRNGVGAILGVLIKIRGGLDCIVPM